jgi:hypothetical protein
MALFYETREIIGLSTQNSANPKTGNMVQTWFLLKNQEPHIAFKEAYQNSQAPQNKVCGGCPHLTNGTCYVTWHNAPLSTYRKYIRGGHGTTISNPNPQKLPVRLGSAGNPTVAPIEIIEELIKNAPSWTGYTHEWKQDEKSPYRKYLMASVDSPYEAKQAKLKGWRYFRVRKPGDTTLYLNEIVCPATTERGIEVGVTCATCGLCNGTSNRTHYDIVVDAHGNNASKINY